MPSVCSWVNNCWHINANSQSWLFTAYCKQELFAVLDSEHNSSDNNFASFVPSNHFGTICVVKEAIVSLPDFFYSKKRDELRSWHVLKLILKLACN